MDKIKGIEAVLAIITAGVALVKAVVKLISHFCKNKAEPAVSAA